MRKFLVLALLVLAVFTTTTAASAQGNTPPQGDDWDCANFPQNLEIGTVVIFTEDYPTDQVWIDGEVFTESIPEEDSSIYMILDLGSSEVRVKKEQGPQIVVVCVHLAIPATATPAATETPTATATVPATATPLASPTPAVTAAPAAGTSAAANTSVILIVVGVVVLAIIIVLLVRKKRR